MSSKPITSTRNRTWAEWLNRIAYWVTQHWLLFFGLIIAIWVILPWLAPVFMELGWNNAGNTIYLLYMPQCHQLPQRSFFLFGGQSMYSLAEIQTVWQDTNDPFILRQFIGSPETGWKVAWSDRMVSMYTILLFWGGVYELLRKRIKPLPIGAFVLLLLPMVLDGGSHIISDLMSGIGGGFRDSNVWLATLTGNAFPATFYAGDMLGSFNSWMRLITGILFGLGVVWWACPRLEGGFIGTARQIEAKFQKAGLNL